MQPAAVVQAVALVSDSNWAMRELMRRSVEGAGFTTVLESASSEQLEVGLRVALFAAAHHALLVATTNQVDEARAVLSSLGRQRARLGFPPAHVILTCEFGSQPGAPRDDFGGCIAAGVLEKPFDLGLLEAMAYRCRTSPTAARAFVVNGK